MIQFLVGDKGRGREGVIDFLSHLEVYGRGYGGGYGGGKKWGVESYGRSYRGEMGE